LPSGRGKKEKGTRSLFSSDCERQKERKPDSRRRLAHKDTGCGHRVAAGGRIEITPFALQTGEKKGKNKKKTRGAVFNGPQKKGRKT